MNKDFFHVALVVPELEPAMTQLTELLGLEWDPIVDVVMPMHLRGVGVRDVRLHLAMSTPRPSLEVIEAVPGTPWELSEGGSNLHHIGFWVDDLEAENNRVAEVFCPMEVCSVDDHGRAPSVFTYHSKGGFRVELVRRGGTPSQRARQ